jgi:hypothetical protein
MRERMAVHRFKGIVREGGESALSRIKRSWRSWRALVRTLIIWAKHLIAWGKRFIVWLAMEPLPFWSAILVVLAAFGVVWAWPTEVTARYVGLGLQLLGIALVAVGIRRTRKEFGHPSIWAFAHQWLRRIPLPGRQVSTVSASLSVNIATGKGFAFVWENAGANASIEARLEVAEKNIQSCAITWINSEYTRRNVIAKTYRRLRRSEKLGSKKFSRFAISWSLPIAVGCIFRPRVRCGYP